MSRMSAGRMELTVCFRLNFCHIRGLHGPFEAEIIGVGEAEYRLPEFRRLHAEVKEEFMSPGFESLVGEAEEFFFYFGG